MQQPSSTSCSKGWISFSDGTGFDGAVHIDHLQRRVAGDPYRLMRLPGFLPALLS